MNEQHALPGVPAVFFKLLDDLRREFARGLEHEAAELARSAQAAESGQGEGGCFARACLRGADDVAALKHDRDGLGLDVGGGLVTAFADAGEHSGRETEILKCRSIRPFGHGRRRRRGQRLEVTDGGPGFGGTLATTARPAPFTFALAAFLAGRAVFAFTAGFSFPSALSLAPRTTRGAAVTVGVVLARRTRMGMHLGRVAPVGVFWLRGGRFFLPKSDDFFQPGLEMAEEGFLFLWLGGFGVAHGMGSGWGWRLCRRRGAEAKP